MTKAPALLPEGLRDRLPAQAEAASRVTRALVDAMRAHGYGRVSPPLAEFRETLGGDDDRSSRDLLRFTDPVSQRTLALRPDITRQVGRIATSLLAKAPRPLRLCYAGQIVKLRASQLRPAREMLQVGAELIGSDGVARPFSNFESRLSEHPARSASALRVSPFSLRAIRVRLAQGQI